MTGLAALVLAGSRGPDDVLARHAGVAHKCLVEVGGRPMLERVAATLRDTAGIDRIVVALEGAAPAALREGVRARVPERLTFRDAAASPSLSAGEAFADLGPPLLVTTGDHPLLTPNIVEAFVRGAQADGADVVAGVVGRDAVERVLPDTRRTYLAFKDGDVSGANLFYLARDPAAAAVAFWRRVEADRKNPLKLAAAFGPILLAAYAAKRLTLDEALSRIAPKLGCSAGVVRLDEARAAVDVDKPEDLILAERLLRTEPGT